MKTQIIDLAFVASGLRLSTPLLLAALGGMFSELGGIVNIALEGLMLCGAFAAAVVAYFTGVPWLGVFAAAATGSVLALLHGWSCARLKMDHIVSGMAINIFALGAPALAAGALFGTTGSTPAIPRPLAPWSLSTVAVAVTFGSLYILRRTPFGLRLRAAGENPVAVVVAGINVVRLQIAGVVLSGVLAGIAGSYLSIEHGTAFSRNMTAGRGYVALAALIFGKWRPLNTLFACLIFGFADALQIRMQNVIQIPAQFVQMLPYILTIAVLLGVVGRSTPPKALGKR